MTHNTQGSASSPVEKQRLSPASTRYNLPNHEALKLAQQALTKIQALDLNANPIHFALFFEKLAKVDPSFAKEVEQALKFRAYNEESAFKLFTELWTRMVQTLIPTEALEAKLNTILQDVDTWLDQTHHYQKNIDSSLEQAFQIAEDEKLKQVLGALDHEVEALEADTQKLKKNIETSRSEIQVLKDELVKANTIANTDELTNIPNRRGYRSMLKNAIEHANQQGQSFAFLVLDIDHFKNVNDTYGHLVGDGVLRYVAKMLYRETKGRDYIARIGGEEFIILLPNTNYASALKVANTIRQKIENKPLKVKGHKKPLNLTVSIGIAMYQLGEEEDSLFERADKALYLAKEQGRNQVKGEADL